MILVMLILFLREYLPLEQGLRQHEHSSLEEQRSPQRVSSIRTRIKNPFRSCHSLHLSDSPRLSSIITRIRDIKLGKYKQQ